MTGAIRAALGSALAGPRARVGDWLGQLQPRERLLVLLAGGATALLALWLGIVEPVGEAISRLDRGLTAARRDAATIDELVARHRALAAEVSRLESASSGGDAQSASVFAQLEAIAVPIAGRDHIGAMNPSTRQVADRLTEESVEMRVEGIPMRALLNLLWAIEHRDRPLQLAKLSFKRQYKNPALVDATIVVARLKSS